MAHRDYGSLVLHGPDKSTYTKLEKETTHWRITATPDITARIKRIFPRSNATRAGYLAVADTQDVARDLEWILSRWPLTISEEDLKHLTERANAHREVESVREFILAGGRLEGDWLQPARSFRDYQVTAIDMMLSQKRMVITDALGLGKAQPLDSLVLTPTGYVPMKDIHLGDAVIAADGTPTKVTGVYPQGELDCYQITFSDGSKVECSDEHLWKVRSSYGRTRSKKTGEFNPVFWKARTLKEIIEKGIKNSWGQARFHIPMASPPDLHSGEVLPLDPYLLGVFLGDGGFTTGVPDLTSADQFIVEEVTRLLPEKVVVRPPTPTRKYGYRFIYEWQPTLCSTNGCTNSTQARGLCSACYDRANDRMHRYNEPMPSKNATMYRHPLSLALIELGLFKHNSLDKFIPERYKLTTAQNRLAMLQGLMDTDGYAMRLKGSGNASAFFDSSSEQLAADVVWLVQSLGGTAKWGQKMYKGRLRYRITVKLPQPLNPFRLPRKAELWGEGHKSLKPTRAIVDVQLIGKKEMQCISVEHSDSLYVTDNFVVTHNTQEGIGLLKDPSARPCLVVTMTHLTHQWQRECNIVWPELKTHIVKKGSYYDLSKVSNGEHPDIVIMNYSKLAGWSNHLAGWAKSVIFDEGQELRTGVGTGKGNAAAHISEQATYSVALTASPVYNYGSEIFNIIDILHKDALGTQAEFSREWGLSYDGKRVQDPAALGAYLKDQGFMMGRTRKEVGRELGEEPQRITYSVDSDEHVLEHIAGDAVAMAQMLLSDTEEADAARFRVAGELDWKLRQATGIAKAPYVAEFVRLLLQSEQKIVLFGWHKAVYEIWAEKLAEFNPVFYTGEESPAQKEKSLQAFSGEFTDDTPWRERKESRVIIISLRAGAGLDGLQKHSSVCVFGELDWSPEVHTQGIGRLYRDGQEDLVMAYFMVSDHGADPVMAEVLEDKRQQSEFIVRPEGQAVTHVANTRDHMRKLAEDILRRNNVSLPEPTMTADEKMDRAKARRKERAKERSKQAKK